MKTKFILFILTLLFLVSCNGGGSKKDSGNALDTSPGAVKSIKLSWEAPSYRTNGDQLWLYEIGGYEIIWKKVEEESWKSEIVHDENGTVFHEHTLENLSPGSYELAIATFDIDGIFGNYSRNHTFVIE